MSTVTALGQPRCRRPALAVIAALLGAADAQSFAQQIQQHHPVVDEQGVLVAVHPQAYLAHHRGWVPAPRADNR
jgi:hypothetical protein